MEVQRERLTSPRSQSVGLAKEPETRNEQTPTVIQFVSLVSYVPLQRIE
jgi:hypothetical protein